MNKVLVGVISSLAALGIVGGAGAIALSSPDVKENLIDVAFLDMEMGVLTWPMFYI